MIAVAAAIGLAITVTTFSAPEARADDYPTWADVAAARNNQAATQAAVEQIQGLIAGLQAEAARTQADAEAKGNVYGEAENKFQAAASKAATLQQQADAASVKASASEQRAGQVGAQLMRGGGQDITTNLLLNSGDADNLLYGLGMSGKITEQAQAIFQRAVFDKNAAQSLTDQADIAKNQLAALKAAAEAAFAEAQVAAAAAGVALAEQRQHQEELQFQLAALTTATAVTEADYLAGVQARTAANASLAAGEISLSGWAKPAGGYISAVFGWSADYGTKYHKGTDLAGGCGSPIFAASSGTVSFAAYGWNGGYGNMILIDHGNGIQTRYGHIVADGILVSQGQSIGVGTQIASIGSTGDSTGCHLHFEVIQGGVNIDPVPFMSDQGITLG